MMGRKRVKAIVVEVLGKAEVVDKPKVAEAIRRYAKLLREDPLVMQFYNAIGTMGMADFQNAFGGFPCATSARGASRLPRPSAWAGSTSPP